MSKDRIERETPIAAPLERVFTLTPDGGKTRRRVVESGSAALAGSEELRSQAAQDNTGGWPQELDALKTRAEQPSV